MGFPILPHSVLFLALFSFLLSFLPAVFSSVVPKDEAVPLYVPLAFSFSVCQPVTHDDANVTFSQSDSAKITGHNPAVVFGVQSLFSS